MPVVTTGQDWARLGEAVRTRRTKMMLSRKQVAAGGGPSDFTLARIERGEPGPYRGKTMAQLEMALRWRFGTAEKIVNGVATDDDLDEVVVQESPERQVDQFARGVRADPRKAELQLAAELIEVLQRRQQHPKVQEAVDALQDALPYLSRHSPLDQHLEAADEAVRVVRQGGRIPESWAARPKSGSGDH